MVGDGRKIEKKGRTTTTEAENFVVEGHLLPREADQFMVENNFFSSVSTHETVSGEP